MTTVDPNSCSWFNQVYEKFEAMGLEVEDIIYQGPVKYVENQVKTVGACVKKFYSETMEDFLPVSPVGSVTTENSGSSSVHSDDFGIYNNCGADVEKEHVESGDAFLASKLDECILRNLSELQSQEPTALVQQNNTDVLTISEKINNPISESTLLSKDDDKVRTEMEEIRENDEQVARNSTNSSSPDPIIRDDSLNDEDLSKLSNGVFYEQAEDESGSDDDNNEVVEDSEQVARTSSNSRSSDPIIRDDSLNDEHVSKLSNGMLYEQAEDEIGSDDDNNEVLEDPEQQRVEIKLDESCVLVDKYEQFFVTQPEGKRRSYKKKIKDVLYMRRWSSNRNHDRENTTSSNLGSGKITVSSSALESSKSLESGWEFL